VRVPDEARLDKAKVTFSFDNWKERQVASTSIEISVLYPPPPSPVRAHLRSIAALLVPASVGWWEAGEVPILGAAILVLLMGSGIGAVALRVRHARGWPVPASVLGALVVSALFLAVFAVEISAGLAGEVGLVARSLFYFFPGLLLFGGLLTGRQWACHVARWGSVVCALFFAGVATLASVQQPMDPAGPIWIWVACGSYALGSLLVVGGFYALGRPSARHYFMSRQEAAKRNPALVK
jgi:hypothetical protein